MTGRDGGATLTPTLSRRERGQDSEAARGLMQTLRQDGDGLVDQCAAGLAVELLGDDLAGRRDGDVDGGVAHVGERLGLLLGDLLLGLAGSPPLPPPSGLCRPPARVPRPAFRLVAVRL